MQDQLERKVQKLSKALRARKNNTKRHERIGGSCQRARGGLERCDGNGRGIVSRKYKSRAIWFIWDGRFFLGVGLFPPELGPWDIGIYK